MITGMFNQNFQRRTEWSTGEIDLCAVTERSSYGGGDNTVVRVTHHDNHSFQCDTGSYYTMFHVNVDGDKSIRSKLLEGTGLSVQLRNKD